VGSVFLLGILCECGDKVKEQQKIETNKPKEHNGKETQHKLILEKASSSRALFFEHKVLFLFVCFHPMWRDAYVSLRLVLLFFWIHSNIETPDSFDFFRATAHAR